MLRNSTFALLLLIGFVGCQSKEKLQVTEQEAIEETVENPPAEGFNETGSDPDAIAIADEVMEAMGGRKNWDNTRFIAWNFFGFRSLIWDKWENRVRIEVPKQELKILMNLKTGEGKVEKAGEELTQADSLEKYLNQGKRIWINDSYWLVMPYKLKDSGVILKHLGVDTTQLGKDADCLQLTFEEVGVTPQNKYHVLIDKNSRLVTEWAYFPTAELDTPRFRTPWANYQDYDGIKLSGDRGERKLSEINVFEQLPDAVFDSFAPVDLTTLPKS